MGTEFQSGEDEKVLEKDGGEVYATTWIHLTPSNWTIKNA